MNGTLSKLFIFAAGAAIGSVVTWKLIKTRYEQIAQEEIDQIKEVYTYKKEESVEGEPDNNEEPDNSELSEMPHIRDYASKLQEQNYIRYADSTREEVADVVKPKVIRPEEFGEMEDEGYDTISLTYYADGVLTDDMDNPIEDVEYMVGKDSLTHFGEYEDDSVFVRNDQIKADVEILLDTRKFSELPKSRARQANEE